MARGKIMRIVNPIEQCRNLANHSTWVTENSIEITDDEWSTIFHCYCGYYDGMLTLRKMPMLFAQYIRELIELKRT
jgi:hypothetical protein